MSQAREPLSGILLDETTTLSLDELSGACYVHRETIMALVEEGIIEPLDMRVNEWRFPASQLPRAQTAMRLQQDLEINLAGVALALELLEEMSEMRARLRQLEESL